MAGYKFVMRRKSDRQQFWALVILAVVNVAALVYGFTVIRSVSKFMIAAEALEQFSKSRTPY